MKKITLLLSALMLTGAAFAHDGKNCCAKGKKECKKEAKAKKADEKKAAETAKK